MDSTFRPEAMANSADPDALGAWLRLTLTDGVGTEHARRLLQVFGLPGNIFCAGRDALLAVVPPRMANALLAPPSALMRQRIEATLAWQAQPDQHVLTLADPRYPRSLLHIPDPPALLYVRGRLELLAANALAVVGSRNATVQGISHAVQFSEQVSRAGVTIVSGLALGIDAAAHEGGLRGAGSTVAFIGTGIDIDYPQRNRKLAQRIAEEGCIVSEYPLGMPPVAANFPRRNRLISGLSRAVLVVEAAAQSGSLITARMAAEQGRDVFAIPGSIHSPLAKGCHQLIRQGAKLIETVQDILEEMPSFAPRAAVAESSAVTVPEASPADPRSRIVIQAMGHDPVGLDALGMRSGLDAAALGDVLLALELEGAIEMLPGGLYRKLHRVN